MMQRIDVYSGSADGRFERLICDLVVNGGFVPGGVAPELMVGALPDQPGLTVVVREGPRRPDLRKLIEAASKGGLALVLVGGLPETVEEIKRALPALSRTRAWHLADDGTVTSATPSPHTSPVEAFLEGERPPPDWDRFWELGLERARQERQEGLAFQEGIAKRRPVATQVLIGVNLAVYALEVACGAPDYTPALMRLGALTREGVLNGEIWRLVTATFLHGGPVHLAMNMYVLWALGSMLERIVGSARFLAVYGAAAIGGSVAGILVNKGMSVGASGAIWGIMCAQMMLAWRGKGIFPARFRAVVQRNSVQNLGINILISLQAGVDWAGHAGGGIAGALMAGTGLLSVGLPRWASVPEGEEAPPDRVPGWMKAAAVLSAAVLAVGLVGGLSQGRVWALSEAPTMARVAVGSQGWTVFVPDLLSKREAASPSETVFGDLRSDPAILDVMVMPAGAHMGPEERAATADALEPSLSKPEEGLRLDGAPKRVETDGQIQISARYRATGSDLKMHRIVEVHAESVRRVDALSWPDAATGWQDLAPQIMASIEPPR